MLVVRTIENPAHPVGKLIRSEEPIGLDHLSLSVNPFGLYVAFSHGLFFGSRQLTTLTPRPLCLTRRLCEPSHLLTSLDICQLALSSQMSKRDFLPRASSLSRLHSRNRVVMEETGLPSTNLSHVSSSSSG